MKPNVDSLLLARGQVNRSRFTLIELLVVIAIIAILAGMLLPALSEVKGVSYRAQCTSNLHQQYVTATHYASDWDNFFPPGNIKVPSDNCYWPNMMPYLYFKFRPKDSRWWMPSKAVYRNSTPYFCPQPHPYNFPDKTSKLLPLAHHTFMRSYGMVLTFLQDQDGRKSFPRLQAVKKPGDSILRFDGMGWIRSHAATNPTKPWKINYSNSTTTCPNNYVGYWHNGGANFLFFAGQVEFLKPSYNASNPGLTRKTAWNLAGTTMN